MKVTRAAACLVLLTLVLAGCGRQEITSTAPQTFAPASTPTGGQSQPAGETAGGEWDEFISPEHMLNRDEVDVSGEVVEIRERLFIAQTNDIYINYEDYVGKTLVYEGIYKFRQWENLAGDDFEEHYVIRYGPGCCGYDGEAGFEVLWDGQWPEEDDWVQVTGVLEMQENAFGWLTLRVRITSLTVLEERGLEYVST